MNIVSVILGQLSSLPVPTCSVTPCIHFDRRIAFKIVQSGPLPWQRAVERLASNPGPHHFDLLDLGEEEVEQIEVMRSWVRGYRKAIRPIIMATGGRLKRSKVKGHMEQQSSIRIWAGTRLHPDLGAARLSQDLPGQARILMLDCLFLPLFTFVPSYPRHAMSLWNSLPPDVSSSSQFVSTLTLMLDSHFAFDRFTLGLSYLFLRESLLISVWLLGNPLQISAKPVFFLVE